MTSSDDNYRSISQIKHVFKTNSDKSMTRLDGVTISWQNTSKQFDQIRNIYILLVIRPDLVFKTRRDMVFSFYRDMYNYKGQWCHVEIYS